jgi:hypothetical protein
VINPVTNQNFITMLNKKIILIPLLLAAVFIITQCTSSDKEETAKTKAITPVELPVVVPGFKFPEDSTVIYGWMSDTSFANNYDSASIYKHAWGVWAGLTSQSGQVFQGDSLLVYETWLGISEIQDLIVANNKDGGCIGKSSKSGRTQLSIPHQFEHGFQPSNAKLTALRSGKANSISNPVNFWVTVSYDPNAACYATQHQILKQSVLNTYMKPGGIGSIPAFPQKSITIKPSYLVGQEKDGLIRLPVWSGPPNPLQGYPFSVWPTCVYADVHNKQQPGKHLTPADTADTNPAHIAAATCNLSDFISFKLDAKMAQYMNTQDSTQGLNSQGTNQPAVAGQIAILMAMHVTTKEISNWTWQTFYWAPDPAHPFAPSSDLAAKLRPSQLSAAASHYACATGYCMVLPNQPIDGGTNVGVTPMFGYNPYLEAGFSGLGTGPNDAFQLPSKLIAGPPYGVQTNCMTCHGLVTSDGSNGYSTDQYISMNDTTLFKNKLQLDFAWSIQAAIINDTPAVAAKK